MLKHNSGYSVLLKAQYPNYVNRLEVEVENNRAIEVYRRNGFEEIPYHEMIRIVNTNEGEYLADKMP